MSVPCSFGAVRQHSVYDINLDSYYTRHLTSYFSIELAQPFQIDVMAGNKEVLQCTHTGFYDWWNIVFSDMYCMFVPGLLKMLISEPQLEKNGCRIVSEHGAWTVSKGPN